MAQRHLIVDDINGEEASETVTFGLDVTVYEIDLTKENAKQLRDGLKEFIKHGRVLTHEGRDVIKRNAPEGPAASDVRAWAQENGVEVSPKGRVSKEVVKQYEEAQTLAGAGQAPGQAPGTAGPGDDVEEPEEEE